MHASQTNPQAPAPARALVQPQSAPAVQRPVASPAPQTPAPVAGRSAARERTRSGETIRRTGSLSQVKALWASGKYAQALEKVDDLLAAHPDNMEGRIWKKKIRAAQEAEAAMK